MTADSPKKLTDKANKTAKKDGKIPLNEASVVQFLTKHPDFFVGKDTLIHNFTLPHESGNAISLVERQVSILREQNNSLQNKMKNIMANAKENDALFEKIRLITLELLQSSSITELQVTLTAQLCNNFKATASNLVFVGDDSDMIQLNDAQTALGELFDKKRTFCGAFNQAQATLFFPEASSKIISAAVIPIHLSNPDTINKVGIPMLIIGSNKADHFNSSLDTLFLDFIGELLAVHISQLFNQSP